jgi:hypothetical protein
MVPKGVDVVPQYLSINGNVFVPLVNSSSPSLYELARRACLPLDLSCFLPMTLPVDPASAISLAKDVSKIITFIIRLARRDTLEMRQWVDAFAALQFQLIRAEDALTVVQDWVPFMSTDSIASQAAAQKADEVGLDERVKELRDHIASLEDFVKQAQRDLDNITRRDLIVLHINTFAKERKIEPLDEGRKKLAHLVKHLDRKMEVVKYSYICLGFGVVHSPIAFDDSLRSAAADLKQAFHDSPFCLQFHPTGHLAEDLLGLMSSQSALPELKGIFTKCGQEWVDLELRADDNASKDKLERVEKSHQHLVSRLYQVLEEWQTSFPDLTEPVERVALVAKEKLMEWFVVSCRRYLALTLAIGGRVTEGKSSLLNAILGRRILPTDSEFDGNSF